MRADTSTWSCRGDRWSPRQSQDARLPSSSSANWSSTTTPSNVSTWYHSSYPDQPVLRVLFRPTPGGQSRHRPDHHPAQRQETPLCLHLPGCQSQVPSLSLSYFQNLQLLGTIVNSLITNTSERFNIRNMSLNVSEAEQKEKKESTYKKLMVFREFEKQPG